MTRLLHHAAFAVGLAVVGWVGAGYLGTHALALGVTVLVAAFYLMGALELHRYHQATGSLAQALAGLSEPPASLGHWLGQLHPSLHHAVRLRIEGERVGLPSPALSPFLAGLLVLLGMLGTFLGMVVTLNGTGLALDSATDLQAVRASLSAPVKGLGLAFGTSVAGVAASAALGLMSALCRRERLRAAQTLDAATATHLRGFSVAHQREAAYKALLQQQVQAMPELVNGLQAMMAALQQQGQAMNEQLLASQAAFHEQADARSTALAASVGQHLQASLVESARVAGATLQPAVEATLAGLAREAAALHGHLATAMQQQADGLADRFEAGTASTAGHWHSALAEHRQTSRAMAAELRAELAAQDEQRLAAFQHALQGMAATLQREWQQAGAATLGQQKQICETLAATARGMSAEAEAHAQRTIAEIGRLVQAAAEAPRAAAEVVAELRQKLSDSMVRDNAMLDERNRLLHTLGGLLDAVNHASTEQRAAIDTLVGRSADLLDRVGKRFTESVSEQTSQLTEVATRVGAQLTGSAVEVASLGEAFGFAVDRFSETNDKLLAQLGRIEGALSQSMTRSDEQLAYYVAQAREVIDLSILSQQQIVDDLQQLAGSGRMPLVSES
ncbi:MAG: DUF802 domain-containing protein [Vitreoscilla sp.]|nr:DUF802 domain-containing protein [Vitreoscilla sp.]